MAMENDPALSFDSNSDIKHQRAFDAPESSSCFYCECFLPDLIHAVGSKIRHLLRPGPELISQSDQKNGWRAKRRKRAESRRFKAMRKEQERGEGLGLILGTPTDSQDLDSCAPDHANAAAWPDDVIKQEDAAGRPYHRCPPYPCSDDDEELGCSGQYCPSQISMPIIPGSTHVYGDDTP